MDALSLSKRLLTISKKVEPCKLLIDVGSDHAYLPIYLYKKNIIEKGIASDITKGSVEKSLKNVKKYNLNNFIDVRLGNGLRTVKINEKVDIITIAGMGGELIKEILQSSLDIINNCKRLILQPQKNIDKVRKFIHEIGFEIIDEENIVDKEKFYTVITCEKSLSLKKYTELQYKFGYFQLEKKCYLLKQYVESNILRIEKIFECTNSLESCNFIKLKDEYKEYREVLKWL